jgi:hypothetical protein
MSLVRVETDDLTDEERALMADALHDFRLVMPGNREVFQVPFRDSKGRLVEVHYVFADRLGFPAGRAVRQPNGHLAVQLG